MCGIWTFISKQKKDYYEYFKKIQHRGPDNSTYFHISDAYIGFHRLAIMENNLNASQPYFDKNLILICNGEIYNYKDLIQKYNLDIKNDADCLTILHLYKTLSFEDFTSVVFNEFRAEFAFVIIELDDNNNISKVIISRDEFGVRPLYYSFQNNDIFISSELKGIPLEYTDVNEFPCGSICSYDYINNNYSFITNEKKEEREEREQEEEREEEKEREYLKEIRETLTKAVARRLLTDKNIEIGFYLSGGLDSSLVCAIASKLLYPKKIRTFSIGFEHSTDLPYAQKVADYIGSIHTEIKITEEEALKIIPDVIYTTCTYDITTIRASCGQYLISKFVRENTNIKVIINGDGSDEVLGGYMFNYYAPNAKEFDDACKELTKEIHLYDCRRLDRCLARFGLEARVPFLDKDFVYSCWKIPAYMRMPSYKNCEKYLLRKAFEGYLEPECLYRTKEAFSDGISSKKKSWFSIIEEQMKNEELEPDTPTREASYYKRMFVSYFGKERLKILKHYWMPKFTSEIKNGFIDPSARVLEVYNK